MRACGLVLVCCLVSTAARAEVDNLLVNGGFEQGVSGWSGFWSRDERAGQGTIDAETAHTGGKSLRLSHAGRRDWSCQHATQIKVREGDVLRLSAWVRVETGEITLSVVTYAAGDRVVTWIYAPVSQRGACDWKRLETIIVAPRDVTAVRVRVTGNGPAGAWVDDVALQRQGNVSEMTNPKLPATLTLRNQQLQLDFDTHHGAMTITPAGAEPWPQVAANVVVRDATVRDDALDATLLAVRQGVEFSAHIELQGAEVVVSLSATGEMRGSLAYPGPFATSAGQWLILPVNEGIGYPADDKTIGEHRWILYGGHGLCMAFYGVVDGERAQMTWVESPDDASVQLHRRDGLLREQPLWDPQMGRFGYQRRLRYIFFERGGYVAMCKRYRQAMKAQGRLVTLAQKRERNPNVDKLIGAVNVWCWMQPAPKVCEELRANGVERILWSRRTRPDELRQLNQMGVLTSRYDIYQDVMDPANRPRLRGWHPDWPAEAWPDDLMLDENGRWRKGWRVKAKDGEMIPCGVLCDQLAPVYARQRIGEELKTHPYRCRFIDTTTASPYRECYSPRHRQTRTQSREAKMELLSVISREFNLVCGSETGHDAAVPYVHYFEGMLSLGPYRVPDAGRNMMQPWDEVPERVAKFQTGHYYRLPLWELVYHDCVVAQWYWGDYNNKLPSLWDRRDLWNALYGTPPMFMFNKQVWERHRRRFAQSYRATCPLVRRVGYAEMLDHCWLTDDHSVQQTRFSNGLTVTANFGARAYTLPDGQSLKPLSYRVDEKE